MHSLEQWFSIFWCLFTSRRLDHIHPTIVICFTYDWSNQTQKPISLNAWPSVPEAWTHSSSVSSTKFFSKSFQVDPTPRLAPSARWTHSGLDFSSKFFSESFHLCTLPCTVAANTHQHNRESETNRPSAGLGTGGKVSSAPPSYRTWFGIDSGLQRTTTKCFDNWFHLVNKML